MHTVDEFPSSILDRILHVFQHQLGEKDSLGLQQGQTPYSQLLRKIKDRTKSDKNQHAQMHVLTHKK